MLRVEGLGCTSISLKKMETIPANSLKSAAGYILQRSFFFFARMSCFEQSTFHSQAFDRVWFFPNCSFKASRRIALSKRRAAGPRA